MKEMTERLKYIDIYPDKAGKLAQKLHQKKDEIELIRKSYANEKGPVGVDEKERSIIAVVSTEDRDREGQIVRIGGADITDYQRNPVLMWSHRYSEPPIGVMMWGKKQDGKLLMKFRFAQTDFAEQIYQLYKDKILRAFSIGFTPVDYDEKSKIFNKISILEVSAVGIPANQSALVVEAYQKGMIRSEQLKKDLQIEIVDTPDESEVEDFQEEIEIIEDVEQAKTMTPDELKEHYRGQEVIEIVDNEEASQEEAVSQDGESEKKSETLEGAGEEKEIVTKPETTEKYHHIPVNTTCKITATITISAEKGIKATYCGKEKKIHTYLFDVNQWTMAEAQAWVKENKKTLERHEGMLAKQVPPHKERWNKSLSIRFDRESTEPAEIPDDFDIEDVEVMPSGFRYLIYSKYLKCKVKNIYWNSHIIPAPLLGNMLSALKETLKEFELKDVRNFTNKGQEAPPHYETIQLNSKRKEDFLIDGTCFYSDDEKRFVVELEPDYRGIRTTIVVSDEYKCWSEELWSKVCKWAKENNFLKSEKFALSGEFLSKSEESWDDLKLRDGVKDPIKKSLDALQSKGRAFDSRGLMFVGNPGTGKTMTGRVILNEFDTTFIWISSKDMQRMSVHYALSLAFELARDLAPTILFIEDIDAWFHSYGTINDLLKTEMDGLKQNKGMITILTSNFPELLPDALLDRPGRFHHIIEFELPTKQYRKEMLLGWTDGIDEKVLNNVLDETEGFSGAHIKELVKFAEMLAEEEGVELGEALLKSLKRLKDQKELIDQIRENKKGLETSLRELFGMKKKELDIEETEASEEELTEEEAKILDGEDEEQTSFEIVEEEKAISGSLKSKFKGDLRNDSKQDVVSAHRRVHQWAGSGALPKGVGKADLVWIHNALVVELKRRFEAENEGETYPKHDSPLKANDIPDRPGKEEASESVDIEEDAEFKCHALTALLGSLGKGIKEGEKEDEKAGEENLVPEETFFCECPKCGAKVTAKPGQHCRDIKCPKCGATMRRASRPGPGKDFDEVWDTAKIEVDVNRVKSGTDKSDLKELQYMFKDIQDTVAELKEGRILSTKNRTLVKEVIDNIAELKEKLEKLYVATEPSPKVEEEKAVGAEEEVIEIEETIEPVKGGASGAKGEIIKEKPEEEKEVDGKATTEMIVDAIKQALTPKFLAELTKSAVEDEFARIRGIVKTEDGK